MSRINVADAVASLKNSEGGARVEWRVFELLARFAAISEKIRRNYAVGDLVTRDTVIKELEDRLDLTGVPYATDETDPPRETPRSP